MTLFDQFERTDDSRSPQAEPIFTFLNRSPRRDVEAIRGELERWFDAYPLAHQYELRQALNAPIRSQFHAAFWELYLHRLLTLLGFQVEVHPALDGTRARPDFRVLGPSGAFLLEATTTESGIVEEGRDRTREGWIIDALNAAPHPNFFVSLRFLTVGNQRPSNREITKCVISWLDTLDPDPASTEAAPPHETFTFRDWIISITAIAKPTDGRGIRPGEELIAVGPLTVGSVNDSERMLKKLRDKSGKYGSPGIPIVIAVNLVSDFQDPEAAEEALFGSIAVRIPRSGPATGQTIRERNGFWMRNGQPLGTRVSAVLAGMSIAPWTIASRLPTLWHNPWAVQPLELDLPLPEGIADTNGHVSYTQANVQPTELFGLPDGWPGRP